MDGEVPASYPCTPATTALDICKPTVTLRSDRSAIAEARHHWKAAHELE